ncbi:type VI secretion system tip protein TssI/VgrG [Chondromyces apiculatus]|uniref:VgrG protein n=1 Tax=Chondromyces apiculatus DSM 436 TaxID=1192034 RepID=A0A017T573_9BACT|nr:type VI secretion system tip protein TssI/VgrG [Chondromyces apiculatus]EYF04384.1 VgrG protein [Chondromyces apiculatus DSM 436]
MSFFDLEFKELAKKGIEIPLTVYRFAVHEAVSTPFSLSLWARSDSAAIAIDTIVGQPASFRLTAGYLNVSGSGSRAWNGVCSYMEQTRAERQDKNILSSYYLRIVPAMWVMEHQRDHRIYQHLSIPDIVDIFFDEWNIKREWRIDRGSYPKLEFKVLYGESHFAFVTRLLEEAGIAYTFPDEAGGNGTVLLSEALHRGRKRPGAPVPYEENPTEAAEREFVSEVSLVRDVRPGAYTIRDYDFRNPSFELLGESAKARAPEDRYEQFHYLPGGFLVEGSAGGGTPVADDRGVARHLQPYGLARETRALESLRADRAGVAFTSNLHDLHPGLIFRVEQHPHPDLARELLVTDILLEGTAEGEWESRGHAVFADTPFRPPLITPRPEALGVQTVTVVGPKGVGKLDEEIHVDEFGRVRVRFPWDRSGNDDDLCSCWMRVAEGWGGKGYGWLNLPRVGQEVIVTFLEGDPDRPVIMGRLYNATHPVPYKLPDHKTVSTWKSDSAPGSGGFNEIKFDDEKSDELFYMQAEKNLRKLVKNDEILTVGHDRDKLVIAEEHETIDGTRTQVTLAERHSMIGSVHHRLIKGNKRQLIRLDEHELNEKNRWLLVEKDQDQVIRGNRRERDEWDLNARVNGDRRERVGRTRSVMIYQKLHVKVGKTFARAAGKELHAASKKITSEAPDITARGPGGFIRIDAAGVTISGRKVDINVSGSPGHGHGAHPREPAEAIEAKSKTGVFRDTDKLKGHGVVDAIAKQFEIKDKTAAPDNLRMLELFKLAMESDVGTPAGGTLLWSGGGDYAGHVAGDYAQKNSTAAQAFSRLEMTPGGGALAKTTTDNADGWGVANPAWRTISRRLAQQAKGDVNVVLSRVPAGETAIFREEVKVLAANPDVTAVNVWLMQPSPTGKYTDKAGTTYDLVPVKMEDALAMPPPPAPPAPSPPPLPPPPPPSSPSATSPKVS